MTRSASSAEDLGSALDLRPHVKGGALGGLDHDLEREYGRPLLGLDVEIARSIRDWGLGWPRARRVGEDDGGARRWLKGGGHLVHRAGDAEGPGVTEGAVVAQEARLPRSV